MRHDWILDVLSDLRLYAEENRLPRLTDGADALLQLAQAELAALRRDGNGGGPPPPTGALPPPGTAH